MGFAVGHEGVLELQREGISLISPSYCRLSGHSTPIDTGAGQKAGFGSEILLDGSPQN